MRIHRDAHGRAPAHAPPVLPYKGLGQVAAQQFLRKTAVSREGGGAHFGASVMAAVGQVEVSCAAEIVRVHELVRQRQLDFARVLQSVVAQHDAKLGREAAVHVAVALGHVEEGAPYAAATALKAVEQITHRGAGGEGVVDEALDFGSCEGGV